jgi:pectate lyase
MRTLAVACGLTTILTWGPNVPAPPSFPGAAGFGAQTPGGRGGRVLVVSTLADAGPGSFREAVTADGPRTVVFAVGGLITLTSSIVVTQPYLTIAGQTATGDGICLRGDEVSIRTHDVVVRYLRSRPGDLAGKEVDAINVMGDSHDVVIDHASATWAVDENLSASGAIVNVTIQWCLIAEGLNHSVHSKGAHGYGSLVRAVGGVTLHHNLWAHNSSRNPRLGDNYGTSPWPVFDVRNNVIYDYGTIASGMTGDRLQANYASNYIRPGPSSDTRRGPIVLTDTAEVSYYVSGNLVEGRPELTGDRLFDRPVLNGRRLVTLVSSPFHAPAVHVTTATEALARVLEDAGATRPRRDAVDARIVGDVRNRTGGQIDSQNAVGGWPIYAAGVAPKDSDGDGIPDAWEFAHGLDPRSAADGSARTPSGYTNLEVYLNAMAARVRGHGR